VGVNGIQPQVENPEDGDEKNVMPIPPASWNQRFLLFTCLALAVISFGCATTGNSSSDPLDAPLPSNLTIQPPDPQLPPHIAAMLGVWTGQMSSLNGFFKGRHALVIQSISPVPRVYDECPNNHACLKGYGYRARAFMSYRAPWDNRKGFWLDVVIESDSVINVVWIRGEGRTKYYLMSPGLKWIRADWTWRVDDYGYATLSRKED
jgi:hypothetical protein